VTTPPEAARAEHTRNCQTPACPNDFALIIVNVDDGSTDFLCLGCCLTLWVGIAANTPEFTTALQAAAAAAPAPA
jgi:hypothetical protein